MTAPTPEHKRRAKIAALYAQGYEQAAIGDMFGISRRAVGKQLRRAGVLKPCPSELPGYKPKTKRRPREGDEVQRVTKVDIPADVIRLTRPPEPCFYCGVRADVPCKHRSGL